METYTLILLIITAILAVICIILAILQWRSISASGKKAILSGLYGFAKTLYDSLKNDGKLDAGEVKVLFNAAVVLIAQIAGKHTDEVEDEFSSTSTAELPAGSTQ